MAGHSKWANIKHRKGAMDAKRAKVFSQVSKIIRTAVKEGGSADPDSNPGLRLALDKARAANMPKEKVSKAIDRGLGITSSGAAVSPITYEGFGPSGVALIIEAATDNPNRTGGEIRHLLSKQGGSLAGPNAASYLFRRSQDGSTLEPTMPMEISDTQTRDKIQSLIEALLEHDDVDDVYTNASWPGKDEESQE